MKGISKLQGVLTMCCLELEETKKDKVESSITLVRRLLGRQSKKNHSVAFLVFDNFSLFPIFPLLFEIFWGVAELKMMADLSLLIVEFAQDVRDLGSLFV